MRRTAKGKWLVVGVAATVILAAMLLIPQPRIAGIARDVIAFLREAGPVPFFIAMAVLPSIGFPLAAFSVVAGPVFGPTMGVGPVVVCAIAATTANVALSYWIASRALRPLVERLLRWLGYRLPKIPAHRVWPVILIVRVVPGPPFFLQSYLLAIARAPFGAYMAVSSMVPACYLSATIILGDGLARRDPWAMGVAAAIFVAGGTALHFIRVRFTPRSTETPVRPAHE